MSMPDQDLIMIDSVARTVSEIEGHPKDHMEVAVILEILGFSDRDAKEAGFDNLFELGKTVHESVYHYYVDDTIVEEDEEKESNLILFFAGMFYNMGWMIMLISLFLGGQSLWAAKDIPVDLSTAIGMGVLLGLVSTGGIQQFTAWKLIYYQMQNNKPLARFIMERNLIVGSILILAALAILLLINIIALSMPAQVVLIAFLFLTLIGIYRLFATPVFAFKKFKALIIISFVALGIMFSSYYIFTSLGLGRPEGVVASQCLGLAVLIFSSAYFTYRYIYAEKNEREEDEPPFYSRPELPKKVKPPRYWVLLYEGIPLILYGTLYFVFIFGDRLVSWIGAGPYLINYNRTYQIGVDLALLLLIPITGVKFTYLYRMSDYLERNLNEVEISDSHTFNRILGQFYNRMLRGVMLFGGLFVLGAFLLGDQLVIYGGGNHESVVVFRWALIGIYFFGLFLTNSVFSLCFRKTKGVVGVLALGCIMAYGLSYLFSTVSQWYSVLGFVLSSFFLVTSSYFVVSDMLSRSDYTYYQAF